MIEGVKHDGAKDPWHLLPTQPVREVVKVLALGAAKYAPDNWKSVPEWRDRYYSAAMRHLTAWREGEREDTESSVSHLAHAICCLVFLRAKEMGL